MILHSRRLLVLAAVPFFISALLYVAFVAGFVYFVGDLTDLVIAPGAWWRDLIRILLMVAATLGLLVALALSYSAFAFLVAGPFYEYLSGAAEKQLTGRVTEEGFSVRGLLGDLAHAAVFAVFLLAAGLVAFLVGIVVPPFTTVLAACGSAYLLALEYMDYPMTRRRMRLRAKLDWAGRHRWEMVGLGLPVLLGMMVPLLGPLLLPVGVVGGTILFVETEGG